MSYDEEDEDDDEEFVEGCIERNKEINKQYAEISEQLKHCEEEYAKYVNKIGFELNDQSQEECLFNLLNNGILLDE